MAGWLSNMFNQTDKFSGLEQFTFDTEVGGGGTPQTSTAAMIDLAAAFNYYNSSSSKTMVAGTRYIKGPVVFGLPTVNSALVPPTVPTVLTGINVLVGGTGGTDKWIAELHDSAGNLLATSATAGVTTGTANQWMQLPFTAPYSAAPGTYYIVIQSNGTTATLAAYNAPTSPLVTGSATGTFGTGASITPPTTYTQALGPVAFCY